MSDSEKKEHDVIADVSKPELDAVVGGGLGTNIHNAFSGVKGMYKAHKDLGATKLEGAIVSTMRGPSYGLAVGKNLDRKLSSETIKKRYESTVGNAIWRLKREN